MESKSAGSAMVFSSVQRTLRARPEYYDDETESGPALEPMTSNSEKDPFIDVFLDKLISRLVPEKLPEREHFSSKTTIEHDLDTEGFPCFQQLHWVVISKNCLRKWAQYLNSRTP